MMPSKKLSEVGYFVPSFSKILGFDRGMFI